MPNKYFELSLDPFEMTEQSLQHFKDSPEGACEALEMIQKAFEQRFANADWLDSIKYKHNLMDDREVLEIIGGERSYSPKPQKKMGEARSVLMVFKPDWDRTIMK